MSGRYLALEGVEGAGKSTVMNELADLLGSRGLEVVTVREPGGTGLGEKIRRLLLHAGEMAPWAEAALFAAQRAQLVAEVVRPALARGAWVVSDRTLYSSLAYQGGARGLGIEAVRRLNLLAVEETLPDLVVVLDVDPAEGLARQVEADRIGAEGLEFQAAVADAYRRLAMEEPERVVLIEPEDPGTTAARILELAEAR